MNELINFSEKLADCDQMVITPINEGRFYCRFYAGGLYFDRMFITDLSLQDELILLSEDDEVISEENIARLRKKYTSLTKATDEGGTIESAVVE